MRPVKLLSLWHAAMAGILISSLLACSSAPSSPQGSTASQKTGGPSKPEGTVTVLATGLAAENWGPTAMPTDNMYVSPTVEFLLRRNEKGVLSPELADSWQVDTAARTVVFKLHQGVQFQDGYGEFTADDVKFSLEASAKEGTRNTGGTYVSGSRIEVLDKYTVVFHMKSGLAAWLLLNIAARQDGYFPIFSKKYYEAVGEAKASQHPIGTGPFRFVEHQPGYQIKFEALDSHWRAVPDFKTLIIRNAPEEGTRLAMVKTGDADVTEMSLSQLSEAEAAGLKVKSIPESAWFWIMLGGQYLPTRKTFDPSLPWVGDPADPQSQARALKVRKALNLAIDRDAIVKTIFKGKGQPIAVPMISPSSIYSDPSRPPYPYNADEAKRLLTEAGYPNGLSFTMWTAQMAGRPEIPAVTEAVAMYWDKINVKASLRVTDWPAMSPKLRDRVLKEPYGYAAPGQAEPARAFLSQFTSTAGSYYSWEDARQDKLTQAALSEDDNAKRVELTRQWAQLVYDNYPMVTIASKDVVFAMGKRIGEWELAAGDAKPHNFELIRKAK